MAASKSLKIETSNCCTPLVDEVLSGPDADDFARVFAALGDPIRLRLFSLIAAGGATCSCNLEGPLQRSQPTISHHTKILADAGLIVGEKRGRWVWWSIVPSRMAQVAQILDVTASPVLA